jgi:hypothetical protein
VKPLREANSISLTGFDVDQTFQADDQCASVYRYCGISLSIERTMAMKACAAGDGVLPRLVMKP